MYWSRRADIFKLNFWYIQNTQSCDWKGQNKTEWSKGKKINLRPKIVFSFSLCRSLLFAHFLLFLFAHQCINIHKHSLKYWFAIKFYILPKIEGQKSTTTTTEKKNETEGKKENNMDIVFVVLLCMFHLVSFFFVVSLGGPFFCKSKFIETTLSFSITYPSINDFYICTLKMYIYTR